MYPKQTIKLTTPKLSPENQREIDEIRKIFFATQQHIENLEREGKIEEKSIEKSTEARKIGNELYVKKGHDSIIHNKILECYSMSIMFAPLGTEELALGYSNRSSLLMHLQLYEESLVDNERASKLSKSDEFKKKLQDRREKCLELMNKQKLMNVSENLDLDSTEELENLAAKLKNFKPSAMVPCAADCVGLAYNDTFGRHLVATRDIMPGEILIVEKGSTCSPILPKIKVVCSHCLQYAWNGVPCDECVYVIYCSETCKNEAFKEYHDIECPMLKYMDCSVNNEQNGCDSVVTIRLLIQAMKKEGYGNLIEELFESGSRDNLDALLTNGILQSDKFKSFYNLLPNVKQRKLDIEQLKFHSTQILYLLLQYTDFLVCRMGENPIVAEINAMDLPGTVVHDYDITMEPYVLLAFKFALIKLKHVTATNEYLFQMRCWQCGCKNIFECDEEKCNLIRGIVTVSCCALLNHSCTPNVSHLCAPKREIIVFSTCPVKKGEMLCDSYNSVTILDGDFEERERKMINFKCKCQACLDKIDMFVASEYQNDLEKILIEFDKNFPRIVSNTFMVGSFENWKTSEVFENMIKISEFFYNRLNYYNAFMITYKCKIYIEKMMSELYKEKSSSMSRTC